MGRNPYKGRRLTMLLRQGSGLGSSAGIGGMMGMRIGGLGSSIEVGR